MHDTLADPPHASDLSAGRTRTGRQILRELASQMRLRPLRDMHTFGWTVDVVGMSDADLDVVVSTLARRGLRAEYVRELGCFAHFTLRW